MLQNIEWSTDKVLQQTMRQAQQLNMRIAPIHTLPTLQDIDTVQVSLLFQGMSALSQHRSHLLGAQHRLARLERKAEGNALYSTAGLSNYTMSQQVDREQTMAPIMSGWSCASASLCCCAAISLHQLQATCMLV